MAEREARARIALFSSSWGELSEIAFVARSVAGAVSRIAPVDIHRPGRPGPPVPDGAFDVRAIGLADGDDWPAPDATEWRPRSRWSAAILDGASQNLFELLGRHCPETPLIGIVSDPAGSGPPADAGLAASFVVGVADTGSGPPSLHDVGLHVPINALAADLRHVGLGFTDYLLVLTDRGPGTRPEVAPTPLARWLIARFTGQVVVVVENAVAGIWRSRSLLGTITIDSRMDLWRLMAHAAATVDLGPGPLVARECVESLRFGVPIVAPAGTAAHRLAAAGGGLWYRDVPELLGCVEAVSDTGLRDSLGAKGHAVVEARYGDPVRFVERVDAALRALRGFRRAAPRLTAGTA